MSGIVLYYDTLLKMVDDAAKYTGVYYLYLDLAGDMPPSPGSIRALAKYYDGDMKKVFDRYKTLRTACGRDYYQLCETMELLGILDATENGDLFKRYLIKPRGDCDFRVKVRDWARIELRRASQNKQLRLYNFGDFIRRYEALLLKRRSKKQNKAPL